MKRQFRNAMAVMQFPGVVLALSEIDLFYFYLFILLCLLERSIVLTRKVKSSSCGIAAIDNLCCQASFFLQHLWF